LGLGFNSVISQNQIRPKYEYGAATKTEFEVKYNEETKTKKGTEVVIVDSLALTSNRIGRNMEDWLYTMDPVISQPSPNAMAGINNGQYNVAGYTGSFSYSIPLHTLNSYDIQLPISLNYHTTGNRVDDIASWVGLGWNLNAGGAISRVMIGTPDEFNGIYNDERCRD